MMSNGCGKLKRYQRKLSKAAIFSKREFHNLRNVPVPLFLWPFFFAVHVNQLNLALILHVNQSIHVNQLNLVLILPR